MIELVIDCVIVLFGFAVIECDKIIKNSYPLLFFIVWVMFTVYVCIYFSE